MATQPLVKKKPSDFIFGKVIGEGSFSNVFLAKEINSKQEYAIKVLEKRQIIREKKQQYVQREKEVLLKLNHPFFIKLHFTFQDEDRLYFGLSYASNGELLYHLKRLKCFNIECTKFYSAEIVVALEYLHSQGIIHRDLKPENILLDENMHIQVTDFGSAKIIKDNQPQTPDFTTNEPSAIVANGDPTKKLSRRNSFVGTAQYVSPEVLNNIPTAFSSDLWALGCIIYQMLAGKFAFHGSHEYHIFQKIIKLEYEFPSDFDETAKNLIQQLMVIDKKKRLGCEEMGGYDLLKSHLFFLDINWTTLPQQTPPQLIVSLSRKSSTANLYNNFKPGFTEQLLSELLSKELSISDGDVLTSTEINVNEMESILNAKDSIKFIDTRWVTDEERKEMLEKQEKTNEYHKFIEGNLIIKQGFLDKKKGLFARRRMFLLTEGPRLFYVDPVNMVLKGEIPWSKDLKTEVKSFKVFFIHTIGRTYNLEDPEGKALKWCSKIETVYKHYYK